MGVCSPRKTIKVGPYESTSEAIRDHHNHTTFMATGASVTQVIRYGCLLESPPFRISLCIWETTQMTDKPTWWAHGPPPSLFGTEHVQNIATLTQCTPLYESLFHVLQKKVLKSAAPKRQFCCSQSLGTLWGMPGEGLIACLESKSGSLQKACFILSL